MNLQKQKVHFTPELQTTYYLSGQGQTVLLLHGFMEDSSMWDFLMQNTSRDIQWVAVDLPGHGGSSAAKVVHSMEYMAERVEEILYNIHCTECICIGHSMGGYVGLALAKRNTVRCTGMILLNSTFEADNPQRKEDRLRAAQLALQHPEAYVRMAMTNLFHEKCRGILEDKITELIEKAQSMHPDSIAAAHLGMKDREDELSTFLKVGSILMIMGEEDSVLDVRDLEAKCNLHSIPVCMLRGGHMSWLENPVEVTRTVIPFLEQTFR